MLGNEIIYFIFPKSENDISKMKFEKREITWRNDKISVLKRSFDLWIFLFFFRLCFRSTIRIEIHDGTL